MAQITVNRTKQKQVVQVQQRQQVIQQQRQDVLVLEEQIVSQQQSLEMMRVLLGASIGCLAYLRSLLPDECFVDQRYGTNTASFLSYALFAAQEEAPSSQIKDKAPRIKRLQRGRSRDADRLLDWLELGVFDALERKHLKSVQFVIYLNEDKPDIIYECYTFNFAYTDGEPALSIVDGKGGHVVVKHAKTDLQSIMRKMIMASQNLAPLPDRRFLTVRLYYNKGTPKDYNPPLFRRDFSKSKPYFAPSENERKETVICGQTALNHHAVGVKVSAICRDADVPASAQRDAKRQRRTFIPADFDVEVPMLLSHETTYGQRQESILFDPSQILATQPDTDMMDVDIEDTIDKRIEKEKEELQKMFKLDIEGDNDTQPMPETDRESTPFPPTVSRHASISKGFESINLDPTQRESMSVERTASLTPTPMDHQKGHATKRKQGSEDVVECECGCKEDEGFMLCCEKCETWKHAVCYGFTGPADSRIPKLFRCYKCNLDPYKLEAMSDLCQYRRILKLCWDDEFLGTAKKIADDYDVEPRKAPALARRFVKDGFFAQLADPSTPKNARQGKRAAPYSYQLIKTAANQRQLDRYMDPNLDPEDAGSKRTGHRAKSARAASHLLTPPGRESSVMERPITAMRNTRAASKAATAVPTHPVATPFQSRGIIQKAQFPVSDTVGSSSKFDIETDRMVRSTTAMSGVSTVSSVMVGVPDYRQFEGSMAESEIMDNEEMESIFPKRWN